MIWCGRTKFLELKENLLNGTSRDRDVFDSLLSSHLRLRVTLLHLEEKDAVVSGDSHMLTIACNEVGVAHAKEVLVFDLFRIVATNLFDV